MKIKVYAHESGPVCKAFMQTVSLFSKDCEIVTDQKSADLVIVTGIEKLRNDIYNPEQQFCVLLLSNKEKINELQPDNVCFLNVINVGNDLNKFLDQVGKIKAGLGVKPAEEIKIPTFQDVAIFKKGYSVLVIDDTRKNLLIAKSVLAKHSVTVASNLQEAMEKVNEEHFDAVLTDMEMPPDGHYSSLDLNRYAVDEKVPYGFAVVLEMTKRGIPVAVVTDGNHHEGWVSAMFDHIKSATVNGQKVLFFNNIGKRWDKALKCLMEG